jgi:hypothetical protein
VTRSRVCIAANGSKLGMLSGQSDGNEAVIARTCDHQLSLQQVVRLFAVIDSSLISSPEHPLHHLHSTGYMPDEIAPGAVMRVFEACQQVVQVSGFLSAEQRAASCSQNPSSQRTHSKLLLPTLVATSEVQPRPSTPTNGRTASTRSQKYLQLPAPRP